MDLFPAAKQPGFLDFTGAAQTNGGFSVLVVFKADSVVSAAINANSRNPVLVNHGNSATTNTFGLRFDATGTMETFLGGTVYQKTGGLKVSAGDTIVYAFSYDALTGAIQFWDSKNNSSLLATSRPFGNFASPQSMKLGTSDNNQQQFNGMIGEVKIFAGKLGSATLITEAQALTTKWGATNPSLDGDGDGLSDADEVNLYHTNPLLPDTDGDGAGDWYEVIASFTNPTNPASKPNIPYPLPKPDNSTGATNKPVKVFILSGQSNMVGMGDVSPLGTAGTLSTLVKQQGKFSHLLDSGGNWSVRNDVWYRGVIAATGNTNLLVGQASSSTAIGPELAFGHVMGYYLNEPVLVLKSSQGGRSLGWDFLPPGSQRYTNGTTVYAGYGDSAATWAVGAAPPGPPSANASYGGWQYDQCFLTETNWAYPGNSSSVTNVTDVLDHWATQYPQWAAQGFEIAGFVWFQGWNDGLSYTTPYADRYETNLVELIKHLRSYYGNRYPGKIKTNAPFVVATSGFNGWSASGNRLQVANAQLAVSNTNKYPGFADNVKTMETRGYWRDAAVSPNSKQDYHYWRNAETFLLVGDALGRGMIDLLGAGTVSDYASWATSFPGANLSDPNADFDGDTLSNDYERIWGLNPTNALSRNPFASISSLQSGSFTYTRRTPSLTLLNYTVWTSTNLLAWTQDLGAGQTPGAPLNQVETVTVNLSPALRTNPSFFVRLRANQQAP